MIRRVSPRHVYLISSGELMAKILVIDDQPKVLDLFEEILVSAGHEVITASDGRTGLELYALHRPVLVITDLLIPGISGLEIIDRLRQEPSVKVIAMTGSGSELLEAAHGLGASVTLRKPFSIQDLTAAVEQLVASGASERL
jgi:CheY-like chemotaxis protein